MEQLELPFPPAPKAPESGVELARMIGAALDEGVVVVLFPERLERIGRSEVSYLDRKGQHFTGVFADCGPWGVRLLELESPNESEVKWWRVKEAAQAEGADLVPVRWEGPIGEIPERYFRPDAVLGVRFWAHAPFFFPLEKPQVAAEEQTSEQDTRNDSVADARESGGEGAADADRGAAAAEGST